ncbi:DUF5807 family protein [Halomarina oriensis]|uniref:Uncharacterized protein n=1 Tax=Halomarina oriensis TaxID=671145 RepID=A0A6B0GJ64_9EURY|nr:DUF5807 family protein [Halomarina oriensis]MWG34946.1 hypothetical protein [Halomarina oriensis]
MNDARREYLAGERTDDILLYIADGETDTDGLGEYGEVVEDGVVLVMPGEQGRDACKRATGIDPMEFAGTAMSNSGAVDRDLTGGACPRAESAPEEAHDAEFLFSFAEEQNEEVGGVYSEGDIVHAYVSCTCGMAYSDRWVVDSEAGTE